MTSGHDRDFQFCFRAVVLSLLLLLPTSSPQAQPAHGSFDEAFSVAQLSMMSAAAEAIRQIERRRSTEDPAASALIRKRQNLVDEIRRRELLITQGSAAAQATLRGETQGIRAEIALLDKELNARWPGFSGFLNSPALSTAEVRSMLLPDEALVLVQSQATATYVWAISPERKSWSRALVTKEAIADLVTEIRKNIDLAGVMRSAAPLAPAATPGMGEFDPEPARKLYSLLFAPIEPTISSARHLFVVLDGPVSSLPISLLVTDANEAVEQDVSDPSSAPSWLIRRYAVTVLPSVDSLSVLDDEKEAPTGAARFVGFGAPALIGSVTSAAALQSAISQGGEARAEALRKLAPLPETREEILRLARYLDANADRLFLGEHATEVAVKDLDLTDATILAFATHGLVSGEIDGLNEPALVLTPPQTPTLLDDGLLTASEISRLRLNADWVILSACNTASAENAAGAESLSGLARAFLFAGARSLLVSHWPVRDDAAARLTTATLSRLSQEPELRKSVALQRAILELMHDRSDPTLAHPFAWAPFVLVGDGR